MKLTRDLSKSGTKEKTMKLLEYETNQGARVVKNTALTRKRIYIGFTTQILDEYNSLQARNEYIVFTNRENVKNMNVIQERMKMSQVSGELQP